LFLDTGSLDSPSCDGQDDGRIFSEVEVGDLGVWVQLTIGLIPILQGTSIKFGKGRSHLVVNSGTQHFLTSGIKLGDLYH